MAWERAPHHPDRPLARDRERFAQLHAARRPLYESVAGAVLADGAEKTPAVRGRAAPRRRPDAHGLVGRRATPCGSAPACWTLRASCSPTAGAASWSPTSVCWSCTARRLAGLAAATLTVPSGEQHKTMAQAERLLRELARAGMQRSDTIVALGGGVVGDLAGFCAATYQRGVAVAHVPTTLVAQVDSAYGGKTGVDLPEGKNYVGAFHQPARGAHRPGRAGNAARRGAARGVRRDREDGADRGRRPVGRGARTRAAAGGGRERPRDADTGGRGLRAHEAERRRGGRARHRLPRGAEPRARLCARARVRHRLRPLAPRRGRRRSGLLVALRVSERVAGLDPAVRRGRRRAAGAAGPAADLRRPVVDRAARPHGAGQEARAARAATSCCCAPRATSRSSPRRTRSCWSRRSRSCAHDRAAATGSRCCTASTSTCSASATPATTGRSR